MKNFTLLWVLFLALGTAATVTDFKAGVYEAISDSDFQKADSLLDVWRVSAPKSQELYPAEFNRYLNEARQSMITLEGVDGIREGAFVLSDTLGNQVGTIGETVVWNDSLYHKALDVITAGIAEWPTRLDFRLGKTAALKYKAEWPAVIKTLEDVINYNSNNGVVWTWEYGDTLAADTADMIVRQAMFENLTEIYESEDEMSPVYVDMLGNTILGAYPDEYRTLNMLGGNRFAQGDKAGAIYFFKRSHEANPTDGLSLCNMAYVYFNDKDTVNATEICNRIIGDKQIDEESKRIASDLLETINAPLQSLRPYDYFFSFLPFVAESVENETEPGILADVHFINSAYLEQNRMLSPFADKDIEVSAVGQGREAIYIWKFPEPKETTLCLMVAFVPDGVNYKIFTIEKSLFVDWMLGGGNAGNHTNYGEIERPVDAEDFIAKLRKAKLIR